MPKPLVGCLCTAALLAATLTHAPSSSPATVAAPSASEAAAETATGAAPRAGASSTTRTVLAAQEAKSGTRIRLRAPRRVRSGARFTVRGHAPVSRRSRIVVLSTKRTDRWNTVARVRTSRDGAFTLKAKAAAKVGRTTWRVTVRPSGRYRAQSVRFTIAVTDRTPGTPDPTADPTTNTATAAGMPTDWTYISDNTSMRWDPCAPITWHYATERQAYPGAAQDVSRAIAMLAAQTGHTFTRVEDRSKALLTIRWATPAQEPMLKGGTVGVGGPSYQSIDPRRNQGTKAAIVHGEVTFDATETGRPGFTDSSGWTWGQVYIHEVMHSLGLGHARGQVQVMYPMASTTNQRFGAGDLTGLTAVGAEKGCIDWARDTARARVRTALVAK